MLPNAKPYFSLWKMKQKSTFNWIWIVFIIFFSYVSIRSYLHGNLMPTIYYMKYVAVKYTTCNFVCFIFTFIWRRSQSYPLYTFIYREKLKMFNEGPSFNNPLWHNGPKPGDFYNFPGSSNTNSNSFNNESGTQRSA